MGTLPSDSHAFWGNVLNIEQSFKKRDTAVRSSEKYYFSDFESVKRGANQGKIAGTTNDVK
tara:strand:- start:1863 stop:2045 length:183 start_codon:yes stop_codon:yes gene_type:complete